MIKKEQLQHEMVSVVQQADKLVEQEVALDKQQKDVTAKLQKEYTSMSK